MRTSCLLFTLLLLSQTAIAQPQRTRLDTTLTGTFAQFTVRQDGLDILYLAQTDEQTSRKQYIPFDRIGAEIETRKIGYKMGAFDIKEKAEQVFMGLDSTALNTFQTADSLDEISIRGLVLGENKPTRRLTLTLTVSVRQGETVIFLRPGSERINVLHLALSKSESTDIYGGGEQAPNVRLTGHRVPIFCEEQGIGRGDQPISRWIGLFGAAGDEWTSYKPVPFFVTTESDAIQVQAVKNMGEESTAKVWADFTEKRRMAFEIWSDDTTHNMARISIRHRDNPLDAIGTFVNTGKLPPLPDWAYGTWMGLQGGRSAVSGWVAAAKRAGNPVRALWIQDWSGRRQTRFGSQLWWRWHPDRSIYFDFRNFLSQMKADSVYVLGYVNQFLANEGHFFGTAKQRGYLVKTADGEDYEIKTPGFPAYLVDLFNPEAYNWLKRTIQENMIDPGMYGWMADYGEWLPDDAYVFNPDYHPESSHQKYVRAGLSKHNQYPVLWAKLNYDAVKERGKLDSIVFFTRSGWVGSADYSTAFWAGDQMVSWGENDGIKSTVPLLLSSGMSGMPINHTDIGGYTTVTKGWLDYRRSKELLFRWIEMNAFTPIFRTHEGLIPTKNAQVYSDTASIKFFAKFGRVHFALKAYLKAAVKAARDKGWPVVRHLWLHYPNDRRVRQLKHQYLLGEDILVLPVLTAGDTTVTGYLPQGEWTHLFTQQTWPGGDFLTFDAPIGQPAVFVRKDSPWRAKLLKGVEEAVRWKRAAK